MDMTLISVEPHLLSTEILLVLVGVLGFFALRRWRWAAAIVVPVALVLLWRLLSVLIPMLGAAARPDLRRDVLAELVIGVAALVAGVGLPALGWRRPSRPAA